MVKTIKIGNRIIGEGRPCFIIAEAGVNHNGKIEIAKALVDTAVKCGADAVKFQTWITDELLTKNSVMPDYQKERSNANSEYELIKRLELSFHDFQELKKYAESKGIIFFSTPDDFKSAEFLYKLGVPCFKVGSGEVNNLPFLEFLAKKGLPIILSTGMSTLSEVKRGVQCITKYNKRLILLHCTSSYPTPYEDVNLRAMLTLKKIHPFVGYSDHTLGVVVPIAARALGAMVLEKHFTLDKNMKGPDHAASADPGELKLIVDSIRTLDKALGSFSKKPTKAELKMRKVMRKYLVANTPLKAGTTISLDMLTFKRTGFGIPVDESYNVVGKTITRDLEKDTPLTYDMLK